MSKDNSYDPYRNYDEDEQFTITGKVINSISRRIRKLDAEVKALKEGDMEEELKMLRIRDRNPAVKDAYDQYQTVLNLAREKYDNQY